MAGATTYEIQAGVRRAFAALMAGRSTIRAKLFDVAGPFMAEIDVPLSQLLSPKDTVDLTASVAELIRFRLAQNAFYQGTPVPPIEIVAGTRGYPLSSVQVLQ